MDRYQRQIILPQVGESGQLILNSARVLVVGAGGLGCPVLSYLSGAGVGFIAVADGDKVELNNLHRQVLFTEKDVGLNKAAAACDHLRSLNSTCCYHAYRFDINPQNVMEIAIEFDLVVDATDRFSARYLLDDACRLLGKPLVYAAVSGFEIQISVFHCPDKDGNSFSYRHLFPNPLNLHQLPNCSLNGTIGVVPGMAGVMQASEVLKVLLNMPEILSGKLLLFDAIRMQSHVIGIKQNQQSLVRVPQTEAELKSFDYALFCGEEKDFALSIQPEKALELIIRNEARLADVRRPDELPKMKSEMVLSLANDKGDILDEMIEPFPVILLLCQSGFRSIKMANMLKKQYPEKNFYSIEGGVKAITGDQWHQFFE